MLLYKEEGSLNMEYTSACIGALWGHVKTLSNCLVFFLKIGTEFHSILSIMKLRTCVRKM